MHSMERRANDLISMTISGGKRLRSTNAGFKLDCVQPIKSGEVLLVEIEEDDISSKVEYLKNVIVCCVLGAHPTFNVLNGYSQTKWGKIGISKVAIMKNGIPLVRFYAEEGKTEVLRSGIYYFDSKPLIVKAWKYGQGAEVCKKNKAKEKVEQTTTAQVLEDSKQTNKAPQITDTRKKLGFCGER
ncbi:hypothetical protein BC332_10668 [Capsicum chinense]|nr:hypothetical protein BC332_10668 [Capsicum chinense]